MSVIYFLLISNFQFLYSETCALESIKIAQKSFTTQSSFGGKEIANELPYVYIL